jgi:hypothetical protein
MTIYSLNSFKNSKALEAIVPEKVWEILTEAKRSPKPFFDCGATAAA